MGEMRVIGRNDKGGLLTDNQLSIPSIRVIFQWYTHDPVKGRHLHYTHLVCILAEKLFAIARVFKVSYLLFSIKLIAEPS